MSRARDASSYGFIFSLAAAVIAGGCGGGGGSGSDDASGSGIACNQVHIVDLRQDSGSGLSLPG